MCRVSIAWELITHYSFESMDYIMPYCTVLLENFTMITSEELINIVLVMNQTTFSSDPFPSKLLMSHLPTIIDTITHIINLCISTSVFPSSCKSAIVLPLIKKPGLDPQVFKKTTGQFQIYRFCLNLLKM